MEKAPCVHSVRYPAAVEAAADRLEPLIRKKTKGRIPARWTALQLLDPDDDLLTSLQEYLGFSLTEDQEIGWELKRRGKPCSAKDLPPIPFGMPWFPALLSRRRLCAPRPSSLGTPVIPYATGVSTGCSPAAAPASL